MNELIQTLKNDETIRIEYEIGVDRFILSIRKWDDVRMIRSLVSYGSYSNKLFFYNRTANSFWKLYELDNDKFIKQMEDKFKINIDGIDDRRVF